MMAKKLIRLSLEDFLATYSVIAEYNRDGVKYTISLTPTK